MKYLIKQRDIFVIGLIALFVLPTGVVYGSENPNGFLICERIKRQGICEEYRLNTLSAADRQLMTRHCTVGALCPEEDRIGYCERYKDPDGLVFDKHYYFGTEKKHDWNAETIQDTCIQSGGKFHEG